jgi:tRNA(Ile)-lysidine synthase
VQRALRREDWQAVWQYLPVSRYVVYIDSTGMGERLLVRNRRPGDRMQPLGMEHEKKVQDILVDAHIPQEERDSIPLFFSGSASSYCAWLGGVCLDQRARLTKETGQIARLSLVPLAARRS